MAKSASHQLLQEEIQQLVEHHGAIGPHDVIEFARSHPNSECYRSFERSGMWNDATAAEIARVSHARQIIIQCRIKVLTPSGTVVPVRRIVSLTEERDGSPSYRLRCDILSDEERLAKLRRDCARDIESLGNRYADLLTARQMDLLHQLASQVLRSGGGGDGSVANRKVAAAAK